MYILYFINICIYVSDTIDQKIFSKRKEYPFKYSSSFTKKSYPHEQRSSTCGHNLNILFDSYSLEAVILSD